METPLNCSLKHKHHLLTQRVTLFVTGCKRGLEWRSHDYPESHARHESKSDTTPIEGLPRRFIEAYSDAL